MLWDALKGSREGRESIEAELCGLCALNYSAYLGPAPALPSGVRGSLPPGLSCPVARQDGVHRNAPGLVGRVFRVERKGEERRGKDTRRAGRGREAFCYLCRLFGVGFEFLTSTTEPRTRAS